MTVHLHYDLATTPGMMFDEVFPGDAVKKRKASHFDSVPYDGQQRQAVVPGLAPVSPCYSKGSSSSSAANSIIGESSDIEHKYHVDPRVLGSGHQGSVRECVDRVTGQRYAVKSVRKSDPAVQPQGLVREIDLLREMNHKGIIRLIDVFEDAECVHIITDLCGGGELFDKIVEKVEDAESGRACFAEDEAARIIHQVLTVVSYMHRRGVVHRDLKPENILFETKAKDSPIRVVDFGLSRRHRPGREPPMSAIAGTPYYVAPEVLRKRYDKSCDLWSVGVITYILLCGYPPFNGDNNAKTHASVLRDRCRFPVEEWSKVSGAARDFVRTLLRKDPRRRMTAEEALDHPWIVRWMANHVDTEVVTTGGEARHDSYSTEVMINGLPTRDPTICGECEKENFIPLFDRLVAVG